MGKILQDKRFMQILNNLQASKGQREIFLKLLQNAKQAASNDITENCPEYNAAWDRERELMDEYVEKGGQELFDQYCEAADETNSIWADEMYLRGIQDAILFISMVERKSVPDVVGIWGI